MIQDLNKIIEQVQKISTNLMHRIKIYCTKINTDSQVSQGVNINLNMNEMVSTRLQLVFLENRRARHLKQPI